MERSPRSPEERWRAKKAHYQDPEVVARYDAERFRGLHKRGATERKWRAIQDALGAEFHSARRVLDVPCGTGRFTSRLFAAGKEFVNADVSAPMLEHAARAAADARAAVDTPARCLGGVRCEAEHLPFADASFDIVLSIRFLFHVPPAVRVAILGEYARVSRRFVVLDLRHNHTLAAAGKRIWARVRRAPMPAERQSLADITSELARSGLTLRRHVFLSPLWSEKLIAVCETRARS